MNQQNLLTNFFYPNFCMHAPTIKILKHSTLFFILSARKNTKGISVIQEFLLAQIISIYADVIAIFDNGCTNFPKLLKFDGYYVFFERRSSFFKFYLADSIHSLKFLAPKQLLN